MNGSVTDSESDPDVVAQPAAALIAELQWFAPRMTRRPAADFALRNPAGLSLGEVQARYSDEALWPSPASRPNRCRKCEGKPDGPCRKAVVEELVVRYKRRLTSWIQEFGANDHEVDDLVQEVFLRIVRGKVDTFDPTKTASFAGFLYVVARNAYRDECRRSTNRPNLVGETLELPGPNLTAPRNRIPRTAIAPLDAAVAPIART